MNLKISKIASAIAATLVLGVTNAQAGIVVDNWTLNLSGVDGLANGTTVNLLDQIGFNGVGRNQHVLDAAGGGAPADGIVEPGDLARVQGQLSATTFVSNGVNLLPGLTGLGVLYEMTFVFDIASRTNTVTPPTSSFTHLDSADPLTALVGASGLMHIYIDAFANGGVVANQVTGAGYADGDLIATFRVLAGDGGSGNFLTINGSDDATFELVSADAGVIRDSTGLVDLGVPGQLLAVTASQFDADPDNNGTLNALCNPVLGGGAPTSTDFCAQEDGRASLQTVPEPASLALIGLALAGIGATRSKSRSKA